MTKQPNMSFSGQSLADLHWIIGWAISDLRMHIGSCPDVVEYADDIERYEAEIAKLERMQARVKAKFPPDFFKEDE